MRYRPPTQSSYARGRWWLAHLGELVGLVIGAAVGLVIGALLGAGGWGFWIGALAGGFGLRRLFAGPRPPAPTDPGSPASRP
jgi:hypothetical protein